jgi:BASS family bile acid:Na+ symporter
MKSLFKYSLYASGLLVALIILSLFGVLSSMTGVFVSLFFVLLSIGIRQYDHLKRFSFTVSVFAAVSVSMFYPGLITEVNGYRTEGLIVPLIQIIMFGMGTAMSLKDFNGVLKMPKGVLVGIVSQFSIMPVLGFLLASSLGFPPEIAAGIVLIGSSPSGVASNVMTYLAKGNLALSVTLTAVSTLMAPIMTPLLMQTFAGEFVEIEFYGMMMSIIKMIIIPIAAGLLFNKLFHGKVKWLTDIMPVISMAGIVTIIAVITAAGRDNLIEIGMLLILAAIIHNGAGYLLGYWGCRLLKMNERDSRTIAIEVGMQNGGMASGIAVELGKAATMGLAPAIFGPWMNISGSFLANWWRGKPYKDQSEDALDVDSTQ